MRALAVLLILLLPAQLAGFSSAATNRSPGPAVEAPVLELVVEITEDSADATVSESAPGTAFLHGTVTVRMPTLRGASVTLATTTDVGWVSQVNPSTFELDNGQTGEFIVTVVVPQGTPSSQAGTLIVNGRAVASGVQALDQDTAAIIVNTYYRATMEAARRTVEMAPGGTATFSLRLTNAGNGVDSFSLGFPNEQDLRRQGWSLSQTSSSLEKVVPGEFRVVTVTLSAPASLAPFLNRETTLMVRATSLNAGEQDRNATLDYSLVAREIGVSVPGVGAVALLVAVIAVGIVIYLRRRRRMLSGPAPEEPPQEPEEAA